MWNQILLHQFITKGYISIFLSFSEFIISYVIYDFRKGPYFIKFSELGNPGCYVSIT
jgi:hypothetical protein